VIVALFNAVTFGISGSAAPQTAPLTKDQLRTAKILAKARSIRPGNVIRIEELNGIRRDAILDNVLPDALEVRYVEDGRRVPWTVPAIDIKSISVLRGRGLGSFARTAGISLAVVAGLCAIGFAGAVSSGG
jgi:hypothetical protein